MNTSGARAASISRISRFQRVTACRQLAASFDVAFRALVSLSTATFDSVCGVSLLSSEVGFGRYIEAQ